VFAHGGTLEKFIGDALIASFGTPERAPDDASRALVAGFAMLAALDGWNQERRAQGEVPLAIGIGLHFGPAVMGDIGSDRSMAFTIIGDTVNTASRLQSLTRTMRCRMVLSDAFVRRVESEAAPRTAPLLDHLTPAGDHPLRGRSRTIALWTDRTRSAV